MDRQQLGRVALMIRRHVTFRLDENILDLHVSFAAQPSSGDRGGPLRELPGPEYRQVSATPSREERLFFIDADHNGIVLRLHYARVFRSPPGSATAG